MAGSTESKKETIGIELPVPPAERPPEPIVKPREKARIQLHPHESMDKAPLPLLIPTGIAAPADGQNLKKETVSVSDLPGLPAAEMEETEPLSSMTNGGSQAPSIPAAPAEKNSMLLMWLLLGVSALILIIQIWTYFS